jgi:transposase
MSKPDKRVKTASAARYSEEFRREAVRLVESGQPANAVARELGIGRSTLGAWVRRFRNEPAARERTGAETTQQELARLRREVRMLREEQAFLKKAAAFFASETK